MWIASGIIYIFKVRDRGKDWFWAWARLHVLGLVCFTRPMLPFANTHQRFYINFLRALSRCKRQRTPQSPCNTAGTLCTCLWEAHAYWALAIVKPLGWGKHLCEIYAVTDSPFLPEERMTFLQSDTWCLCTAQKPAWGNCDGSVQFLHVKWHCLIHCLSFLTLYQC